VEGYYHYDPDRGLAGKIERLERELAQWLGDHLTLRRELKGGCPGEELCAANGVIFEARQERPDAGARNADICETCVMLETKPGQEPPFLTPYIALAAELDEAHQVGGVFSYPDALTPVEWTCLRALHRGRMEEERRRQKSEEQAQTAAAEVSRLDSMRRR